MDNKYLHKNFIDAIYDSINSHAASMSLPIAVGIDAERSISRLVNNENIRLIKITTVFENLIVGRINFKFRVCNLFTLMLSVFGNDDFPISILPNNGDVKNREKFVYRNFEFWFDENDEPHVFNANFEESINAITKFQL